MVKYKDGGELVILRVSGTMRTYGVFTILWIKLNIGLYQAYFRKGKYIFTYLGNEFAKNLRVQS